MSDVRTERAARQSLTALLALYGAFFAFTPGHYTWLDALDLAIHEAGHAIFGIFGEAVGIAGGTLMQLLVPALFVGYFWRRADRHAATVMLWWIAQNLWNIFPYIADARTEELPLVGGGEHDWAYMLGRLGLLRADHTIAGAVHVASLMVFIWSCLQGWMYASAIGRGASRPPEPSGTAAPP